MARRISAAQARNYDLLNKELEQDLDDRAFRTRMTLLQHQFLEPWELVDPTIEHVVTLVLDPSGHQVKCTCGAYQPTQTIERARLAARTHREDVMRAKRDYRLDDAPMAVIERQQMSGGPRFRWACDTCAAHGEWLASEPIVALGSMLHHDACPTWEALRDRTLRSEGGQRA